MALALIFLLVTIGVFAFIAAVPVAAETYQQMREQLTLRGWSAVPGLTLRALLWVAVVVLGGSLVPLLGMFSI